ncbi:MAG TPA: hypothetical protein VEX69_00065 [Candidatus Limnocylindria bacterium]|nr:hypothetical protein [Candidatus Limnocylindria bacterium]
MKLTRKCASGLRSASVAAAILFFLVPIEPLRAQTSGIPVRLSPDTTFYMHWRGKPFITEAEKKNHLLQFLEDPDFAPLRQKLADDFRKNMESQGSATGAPTLAEFISLLDNPMTIGLVANPPPSKIAAGESPPPLVGFFFVYDATGKAALIEKLRATPRVKDKEASAVMTYEFEGTTVEAHNSGTAVSYTAHAANFYIIADQKQVIEDLITRFRGPTEPASSVTQLPRYKEIRPYIGLDAAVEFFAQMPDLDKIIPADRKDKPFAHVAQNIHLEKLHVMGGGLSFAGEATRFHGAILGDTSPIGVLDVAGPSTAAFVTQPVVSAGPFFSISKFSWAAAYELFRAGSAGSVTSQQAANFTTFESMAQNFLGMSLSDALQLFTGEVASETTFAEDGTATRIYAVTIQKSKDVLRVLRAIVGTMIVAEDTAGDTTFLDLSFPGTDAATGQQKRTFFYIAVTPEMIYAAPRKAMVRGAMARLHADPSSAAPREISSNPDLNHLRTLLPERLSGLNAADMSHFPWEKLYNQYKQLAAAAAKNSKDANSTANDYWNLVKPEVFSRHFHTAIYGWWKDSNGVYFDSFVQ